MIKGGLGRGLSSLIPGAEDNQRVNNGEAIQQISVEQITSNRWQPREVFDHAQLEDLVASIKAHGILQPLILTSAGFDKYELIAGERRWRAAKIAGLLTVPAIVRNAQDQQKLELAIIENIQRQDLNPLEEARSFERLMNEFSLTQEEVAARLGKKRSSIANALRILELPEVILQALADNKLTMGHAKAILSVPTEKGQLALLEKILTDGMSVRQTETISKKIPIKNFGHTVKTDPVIKSLEDILQQSLGTKVHVHQHSSNGGTIVIDYFSGEELQRLVGKISGEDLM